MTNERAGHRRTRAAGENFRVAKACFAENLGELNPLLKGRPMSRDEAALWNLTRGLAALTDALEERLDAIDAQLASLSKGR